ncbi:MAG: AAA family ATPase [Fusobacteriaceae bacterium]
MKLNSFKYKNSTKNWEIEELNLSSINLIVGQNATGKTRTIQMIKALTELISGQPLKRNMEEEYEIILSEENIKYKYILKLKDKKIIEEKLIDISENERLLLNREESGEGKILSIKDGRDVEFGLKENQLAIVYKNDKIHHEFLEKIIQWSNKAIFYFFGSALGKYKFHLEEDESDEYSMKETDKVVRNYMGVRDREKLDEMIKEDLKKIGYNIEKIGVEKAIHDSGEVKILYVKEEDLPNKTYQFEMSQGMFRALSIIIQMNICFFHDKSELISIDDIGEGLDYERASSLIKVIVDKAKNSKVQIIMTTNDRFVMNNINIEYWHVIKREAGNIKFFNKKNSKDIFEDFEYTGLSNFDFLSRKLYLGDKDE